MVAAMDEAAFLSGLGARIALLREGAGLSQREMAAQAGVARSHYARLEGGTHNPSVGTLLRVAGVHGMTVVELLGDVQPR